MTELLIVTLDYSEASAAVVQGTRTEGSAAIGDEVDDLADGVWVELRDDADRPVFRRTLPSPHRQRESYEPDGSLRLAGGKTTVSRVTIAAPWLGFAARLRLVRGVGEGAASPEFGLNAGPTELLSFGMDEVLNATGDGQALELGLGYNFPVIELPFGRAHGGEIRLVFVPDGFTAAELPAFHRAVDGFLADFAGTSPFPNLLDAFSACRIDVPSRTSGIRDPLAPGNGADPVFGARFGKGELRRCIEVDQPRVGRLTAALGGRQLHKVAVVVANTADYGGSGGDVAVFSCDTRATAIAIHELGHTIFNLADEYGDAGQASSPRPIEVNVAAKPDPHNATWGQGEAARLKWAARLTPGIALPSPDTANPDAVGAFQGAKYDPTRYWRPSVTCKMRNVLAPFCPVCSDHIRARLAPHRPA